MYSGWITTAGTNWGNAAAGTTFTAVDTPTSESLSGGLDGTAATDGRIKNSLREV